METLEKINKDLHTNIAGLLKVKPENLKVKMINENGFKIGLSDSENPEDFQFASDFEIKCMNFENKTNIKLHSGTSGPYNPQNKDESYWRDILVGQILMEWDSVENIFLEAVKQFYDKIIYKEEYPEYLKKEISS